MNFRSVFLYTAVVVLSFPIKAQVISSPFIIKTYTAQDGLPHNYVLNLWQDKKGYLWVGTIFGLCRFDGAGFTQVKINGKENKVLTSASEMPNGTFWISTKEGAAFLFDGKNILPLPDSLPEARTMAGFKENNFTTRNFPHSYPVFYHTPEGMAIDYFEQGLFISKKGDTLKIGRAANPGFFMRIIGYANKEVYYFTDRGLYAWSPENKLRTLYEKQLSDKRIYNCYYDSKKRFWIGTYDHGIFISQPGNEKQLDYQIQPANNLISGFYEDNEENIWIAGFEGLTKVYEKKYETFSTEKYPFLTGLNFIAKDEKGIVYSFSEKSGFCQRDKGKFTYNPANHLKGHMIDALCHDDKNRFWCVTRRNKIILFDHGKIKLINDPLINASFDLDWHIVYDERRKKVWVPGDSLLTGDENGFSFFRDKQKNTIKKPGAIGKTNKGEIIVATYGEKLFLVKSDDDVREIKTPGNIYPQKIYRFFTDSTDFIWVSYPGEGLLKCRMDGDELKIIRQFGIEEGLVNDLVLSFTTDKKGRLWLSTMGGIAVLDAGAGTTSGVPVYLFRKDEGIPYDGLQWGHLLNDDNGNMWYSINSQLMKFPVDELQFSAKPPVVTIENIKLNNRETNWNNYTDSLQGIFQLPQNPVMKHWENSLTFIFRAANLSDAENVKYSYYMTGVTSHWSNSSKSNSVTFTNLKPGKYKFFIRARTNNYSWSTPYIFSFIIRKPYWLQNWFRAGIILVIAGALYGLYRFRINHLKKEKQIRDQIAADLHDDLGSTLNSVKVYADLAGIEKENREYLEKIKDNTQEAIMGVRDIIWMLDDKKDTLFHLFNRLNHFADPLCQAAHIQFILDDEELPEDIKLNKEEKRNLYMILKESVNNAVKYARCKKIVLTAESKNKKIHITVQDDGIGFEMRSANYGNGIKNIYARSNEIGYTVDIISETGKGTSICLTEN
jgi:ligand-binding sensor domain-containing protein